jgi:hypothetical protein
MAAFRPTGKAKHDFSACNLYRGTMGRFTILACGLALSAAAVSSAAGQGPTYQSLWTEATQNPGCTQSDNADFTLVTCRQDLTTSTWYFTKPGNPAHPAVISRVIRYQPSGAWSTSEHGNYFAGSSAAAFQAWFAQIRDLDRQMKQRAGAIPAPPPSPSGE